MITPPAFIIMFEYFSIQRVFDTKKLKTKKGTPNPIQYTTISIKALLGSDALIANIAPIIGPLHGVHPAANAIPIKIEPKKPDGLFLNSTLWFFIRKSNLRTPVIISPKTTIKIAPI